MSRVSSTFVNSTPFLRINDPDVSRCVAVHAQKGGVGKSTTACNIASAAARLGFKVAVIDADPNRSTTKSLFGLDTDAQKLPTIAHLLSEKRDPGASDGYFTHAPQVWQPNHELPWERGGALPGTTGEFAVLPGDNGYGAVVENAVAGMPRPESHLRRALSGVARYFDLVIIDTQGEGGLKSWLSLEASASLLAVCMADPAAVDGLINEMQFLHEYADFANWQGRLAGIVPTSVNQQVLTSGQAINDMRQIATEREDEPFGDLITATLPGTRRTFTAGATVWSADQTPRRNVVAETTGAHAPISSALSAGTTRSRLAAQAVVAPHVRMALKLAALTEAPSLESVVTAMRKHPIPELSE